MPVESPAVDEVAVVPDEKSADGAEAGAGVPQQHKSAFVAFLKSIASFTGDLSQLTAPSFLLNGISLTEYSTHWCDYPHLFAATAAPTKDPAERMLAVARWFVSTLYGSYHERCANGAEKKPYNPILGEQFKCRWLDTATQPGGWGSVEMVVEQVSHHPPVTAFHFSCDKAGVQVTGHCGQKSKLSGMNIKVEQTGRAKLVIKGADGEEEEYHITYPDLIIRGLLTGQMFLELSGSTRIVSTTGMQCSIQYLPKPWFSGDYHHINGRIFHVRTPDKPLYTMSGRWTTAMAWQPCAGSEATASQQLLAQVPQPLFDVAAQEKPALTVAPLSEQTELESRRVWQQCTDAIKAGNFGQASKCKSEIEDYQRQTRKEREKQGDVWKAQYFEWAEDGGDNLLEATASSSSGGRRGSGGRFGTGYWRFIKAK